MQNILKDTEKYYTGKVKKHGNSPQGVDWKDEASQYLRFDQLLKIIDTNETFTLADLGCGYGALFSYMKTLTFPDFKFTGYDLSEEMIKNAQVHNGKGAEFHIIEKTENIGAYDYITASGIFNVKMDHSDEEWHDYILKTLDIMNDRAEKGFAFNVLTKYSDAEFMRDDLHYADPLKLFDYCKTNFSRNVALLHDYELYEFTILVRK